MIYFTKLDTNILIIKIIDNTNTNSMTINLELEKNTLNIFRRLYQNIKKNINDIITFGNLKMEYNNNVLSFSNLNFEYKISKSNELLDMFDKVITNLMINDLEGDSPKKESEKFEK